MSGNITTGLSSRNRAKRDYLGRVEKMLEYLEVIGLSNVGHQTLGMETITFDSVCMIPCNVKFVFLRISGAYCTMTWNNWYALCIHDL